jgi:hypothetical protein
LIGGVPTGSCQISVAAAFQPPAVTPPRSTKCRVLATQQNSRPSTNTGQVSMTSCWWQVPTHGSLATNMSPSAIPGLAERCSSTHFTLRSCIPEWNCR